MPTTDGPPKLPPTHPVHPSREIHSLARRVHKQGEYIATKKGSASTTEPNPGSASMTGHVVGAPGTARQHTAAQKGSASTTEPDPGSASMASHVGGEIDTTRKRQSALRGSSSTIEPNSGSASTASHTVGSQHRSKTGQGKLASMADTYPPRPRGPAKCSVPTRHVAHGAIKATGLHP
jgi:hypothetical protein